jgi:hypothetical protein
VLANGNQAASDWVITAVLQRRGDGLSFFTLDAQKEVGGSDFAHLMRESLKQGTVH